MNPFTRENGERRNIHQPEDENIYNASTEREDYNLAVRFT